MLKLQRAGSILILALLIFSTSFYFWGGSGQLAEDKLSYIDHIDVATEGPDSTKSFSVMTYNIGYLSGMTNNLPVDRTADFFANQLIEAKSLVQGLGIDIIGYQEIDFGSARSFQVDQLGELATLGYPYSAVAINWDKNYVPFPYWPISAHFGQILSGQAVSSKFQITSTDRVVLPKPRDNSVLYNRFYLDRIIQVATVSIFGKEVKLMNVHLEAFDTVARLEQVKIVMQFYQGLAASYPVILMGDFNSVPPFASDLQAVDNAMYIFYNDTTLSPAISKAQYLNNEPAYLTYDSKIPTLKLDHIFFSTKHFEVLESTVVHEAGQISDHLPVAATLKFRD